MTFILGARCADGIVLVADRKMTRSHGSSTYEQKIFEEVDNVVMGSAGVVGLYDKFRRRISEISSKNTKMSPDDFISDCETVVSDLNTKYIERTRGGIIELLVGYGRTRAGHLQYVTHNGVGEEVRQYKIIGSGESYGEYFMRKMFKPDMSMKEVAILGTCVIKIIEENDLDEAVGIKEHPSQIWFIPDWVGNVRYEELEEAEQRKLDTREVLESELTEIMVAATQLYNTINAVFNKLEVQKQTLEKV